MGEEAKRSPHYIMCNQYSYIGNAIVEEADTQEVGLDKQQVDLDKQAQLV